MIQLYLIIAILAFNCSFAQQSNDSTIYDHALKQYLHYLDSIGKNNSIIYIENNDMLTNIPENVQTLNQHSIQKLAKRESFELYKITPMRIANQEAYIAIIRFYVSKKRNLVYTNRGGAKAIYKYDCTKSKFYYKGLKFGGR